MKENQRVTIWIEEEAQSALSAIMQHYGISSKTAAMRRALMEHAKQLIEPEKIIVPMKRR